MIYLAIFQKENWHTIEHNNKNTYPTNNINNKLFKYCRRLGTKRVIHDNTITGVIGALFHERKKTNLSKYIIRSLVYFQGAEGLNKQDQNQQNVDSMLSMTKLSEAPIEPGDISGSIDDTDPKKAEKRNFGRWRNANWNHGKRNLGRWKNRRWLEWQQHFTAPGYIGGQHSVSKRFSGSDFSDVIPMPYPVYDDIVPFIDDPTLLDIDFGDDLDSVEDGFDLKDQFDKRHASRWNYIHRKLAALGEEEKREDKRMAGRWRLIHNKLNELNNSKDKRFAGRWRNQNWLLNKITPDDDVQKRNFGRWKNRNWALQKFAEI